MSTLAGQPVLPLQASSTPSVPRTDPADQGRTLVLSAGTLPCEVGNQVRRLLRRRHLVGGWRAGPGRRPAGRVPAAGGRDRPDTGRAVRRRGPAHIRAAELARPGATVAAWPCSARHHGRRAHAPRQCVHRAGGFSPRLWLGGEEELLSIDLAAAGWWICWSADVIVHRAASVSQDRLERRILGLRNTLWTAWLRRPLAGALRHTAAVLASAPRDYATAIAVVRALAGLGWVARSAGSSPTAWRAGCGCWPPPSAGHRRAGT
jgi:hypothetical protein